MFRLSADFSPICAHEDLTPRHISVYNSLNLNKKVTVYITMN